MTEYQKMVAGEMYLSNDPELVEARTRAREAWMQLNALSPRDTAGRVEILSRLLGRVGAGVQVETPFYFDYGPQIELGDGVFINMNCLFLDCTAIRIGAQAFLGPSVQLYTATHPLAASIRVAGPESARPITIGARAWLGGGTIVCPGVTIGEDTTIGAGSVVVRDIPSGVLAAGNPCRVIRTI